MNDFQAPSSSVSMVHHQEKVSSEIRENRCMEIQVYVSQNPKKPDENYSQGDNNLWVPMPPEIVKEMVNNYLSKLMKRSKHPSVGTPESPVLVATPLSSFKQSEATSSTNKDSKLTSKTTPREEDSKLSNGMDATTSKTTPSEEGSKLRDEMDTHNEEGSKSGDEMNGMTSKIFDQPEYQNTTHSEEVSKSKDGMVVDVTTSKIYDLPECSSTARNEEGSKLRDGMDVTISKIYDQPESQNSAQIQQEEALKSAASEPLITTRVTAEEPRTPITSYEDFENVHHQDKPTDEGGVKEDSTRKVFQFSSEERYENWMTQRRRRLNGRYDQYYFHGLAKCTFRSKMEVARFVLHEIYPPKPTSRSSKKAKDDDSIRKSTTVSPNDNAKSRNEEVPPPPGFEFGPGFKSVDSSLKRKRKTTPFTPGTLNCYLSSDYTKEQVPHHPGEDYGNMQNGFIMLGAHPVSAHPVSDDYIDERPKGPMDYPPKIDEKLRKKVEDFLSECNNNLLNYFDLKLTRRQGTKKRRISRDIPDEFIMSDPPKQGAEEPTRGAADATLNMQIDENNDNSLELGKAQTPQGNAVHAQEQPRLKEENAAQLSQPEDNAQKEAGVVEEKLQNEQRVEGAHRLGAAGSTVNMENQTQVQAGNEFDMLETLEDVQLDVQREEIMHSDGNVGFRRYRGQPTTSTDSSVNQTWTPVNDVFSWLQNPLGSLRYF